MLTLELSLSSSLTASEQGSLTTTGEFLNVSALDPLLPTFLIATLCLCALSVITYYSLAVAWECQETRTPVTFFPFSSLWTLPLFLSLATFPLYILPNRPHSPPSLVFIVASSLT